MIPTANKQKDYTPKGYIDLDLEWLSLDEIIVARAKENKRGNWDGFQLCLQRYM